MDVGPFARMYEGDAAKSRDLADEIALVAKRAGAAFWDAATVAGADPVEGIHLTAEGHRAIGQALAARVPGLLGDRDHRG